MKGAGKSRRPVLQRLLNPKSFLSEVGVLMAGAGGAQLITVATAPLLARLFAPSEFGALALLNSSASIIARVSSGKYETAISAGRNRPVMAALAVVAFRILLWATFATLLAGVAAYPFLAHKFGPITGLWFIAMLTVIVLLDGVTQIVTTWSVRRRKFKTVSTTNLSRSAGIVASQAGLGFLKWGAPGLLIGQAVGSVCALAMLMGRGGGGELLTYAKRVSRRRRRVIARRFVDFPLYQLPKAVLNTLARNTPPILLTIFFNTTVTGLFAFAFRLTLMPANLLSLSLGQVIMQRISDQHAKGKSVRGVLWNSTLLLSAIAAPLILVISIAGPELFAIFLGERWRAAGSFVIWTTLWSASIIVSTPAQMALMVLRKNRLTLMLELIFILPRTLPFVLLSKSGNADLAVALCSIVAVISNLILLPLSLRAADEAAASKDRAPSVEPA